MTPKKSFRAPGPAAALGGVLFRVSHIPRICQRVLRSRLKTASENLGPGNFMDKLNRINSMLNHGSSKSVRRCKWKDPARDTIVFCRIACSSVSSALISWTKVFQGNACFSFLFGRPSSATGNGLFCRTDIYPHPPAVHEIDRGAHRPCATGTPAPMPAWRPDSPGPQQGGSVRQTPRPAAPRLPADGDGKAVAGPLHRGEEGGRRPR